MKTIFILFIVLIPFFGFGQTDSTKRSADTANIIINTMKGRQIYLCNSIRMQSISLISAKPLPVITHQGASLLGGLPHVWFRFNNKPNEMANTQAGVLSIDGATPSIRGARPDATAYYINGVRVMDMIVPDIVRE